MFRVNCTGHRPASHFVRCIICQVAKCGSNRLVVIVTLRLNANFLPLILGRGNKPCADLADVEIRVRVFHGHLGKNGCFVDC